MLYVYVYVYANTVANTYFGSKVIEYFEYVLSVDVGNFFLKIRILYRINIHFVVLGFIHICIL